MQKQYAVTSKPRNIRYPGPWYNARPRRTDQFKKRNQFAPGKKKKIDSEQHYFTLANGTRQQDFHSIFSRFLQLPSLPTRKKKKKSASSAATASVGYYHSPKHQFELEQSCSHKQNAGGIGRRSYEKDIILVVYCTSQTKGGAIPVTW